MSLQAVSDHLFETDQSPGVWFTSEVSDCIKTNHISLNKTGVNAI